MNAFTRLCLHTTADVLEQIVLAIRGTQPPTEQTQPVVVHIAQFTVNEAQPRKLFGRNPKESP